MSKLGHCREGYHHYCGGVETDRGDGSRVFCECPCHAEGPDAAYDTREEQEMA